MNYLSFYIFKIVTNLIKTILNIFPMSCFYFCVLSLSDYFRLCLFPVLLTCFSVVAPHFFPNRNSLFISQIKAHFLLSSPSSVSCTWALSTPANPDNMALKFNVQVEMLIMMFSVAGKDKLSHNCHNAQSTELLIFQSLFYISQIKWTFKLYLLFI